MDARNLVVGEVYISNAEFKFQSCLAGDKLIYVRQDPNLGIYYFLNGHGETIFMGRQSLIERIDPIE